MDYALERTTAWVTRDVAWLSIAPVTLRTGVAEEPGELGDELGVGALVVAPSKN